MAVRSDAPTRLRGVWLGVSDMQRSRAFYETLGASFDGGPGPDGIMHATLGDLRLVFEEGQGAPGGSGFFLLLDTPDADALHDRLLEAGSDVQTAPTDEPWGRQFNVHDPDGHPIALIGPTH